MLKLASIAFAAAMLAQAMALPSPNSATTGSPQLASFENDPSLPASPASPIGIYQNVFWKGMSLAKTEDSTGLTPNSLPNFAALQGTPEITTVYDGSTFSSLTLNSFFYGCALSAEEKFFSTAVSCSVTIKGFSAGGIQVATETFAFFADGLEQPMVQANPNGFSFVQYITFEFEAEFGAAALIDTVSFDVFSNFSSL